MDVIDRIRRLVALMEENDLAELELQEPDFHVRIKANVAVHHALPAFTTAPQPVYQAQGLEAGQQKPSEAPGAAIENKGEKLSEIVSPMVGTFYRAPSDGAEPYVTIGTVVEPDSVVCIIEAMKVMNEVKGETSGEIVEILVQNGEPVEFGQALFLVRPPKA
jgi:acetyl-CoA carboxylase biotin carboxyl carrier protein